MKYEPLIKLEYQSLLFSQECEGMSLRGKSIIYVYFLMIGTLSSSVGLNCIEIGSNANLKSHSFRIGK